MDDKMSAFTAAIGAVETVQDANSLLRLFAGHCAGELGYPTLAATLNTIAELAIPAQQLLNEQVARKAEILAFAATHPARGLWQKSEPVWILSQKEDELAHPNLVRVHYLRDDTQAFVDPLEVYEYKHHN